MRKTRPLPGICISILALAIVLFAAPGMHRAAAQDNTATNDALADVAARAVQSVVNVSSTRFIDHSGRTSPFGQYAPGAQELRGVGSGVIVSDDGIIVTNNHVVADASGITVTGAGGRQFPVSIVGADPLSDIAVLRITGDMSGFRPLPWGSSTNLRLGEIVLAVGNPLGLDHTVTMGIVSAKGRANVGIVDYEDFIQTDAAINPGNSGGALINLRGELVGINTAIASETGGYQGIGFSIPSDMIRVIMDSLVKTGKFVRGFLGVGIQTLTPELAQALGLGNMRGALVSSVQAGSPAARAGIERYDVIVAVDGRETQSSAEVRNYIALRGPGKTVTVRFRRNIAERTVTVILAELPVQESSAVRTLPGQSQPESKEIGIGIIELDASARQRFAIPEDVGKVVVVEVVPGSRAEDAGFLPGDVILEMSRKPATSAAGLRTLISQASGPVPVLVWREGQTFFLVVEKP